MSSWSDGNQINTDGDVVGRLGLKPASYVVWVNGSNYEAVDAYGKIAYGGSGDAGGADGADAAAVINAAITALTGGGAIYFHPGTYTLNSSISITTGGIQLIGPLGSSYDQVAKLILADNVNDAVIKCNTRAHGISNSIRVKGFYIHGNSTNQTAGDGIYCNGPAWSFFEDIEFQYIYSNAINFTGVAGSGYNQVNTVRGIHIRGGVGADAINLDTATDCFITACDLNATGYGIHDNGGANAITGNFCYLSGTGIYLDSGGDLSIVSHNRCDTNTNDGIFNSGNYVTITGNLCESNGRHGILTGVSDVTVTGNTCKQNSGNGILNYGDRTTISANDCNANVQHGIQVYDAEHIAINGNICMNNDTGSAGYDGLFIDYYSSATQHMTIMGNILSDNQGSATQRYGLRIDGTTDYLTLKGNRMTGNRTANVYYISTGTHNTFDGLLQSDQVQINGATTIPVMTFMAPTYLTTARLQYTTAVANDTNVTVGYARDGAADTDAYVTSVTSGTGNQWATVALTLASKTVTAGDTVTFTQDGSGGAGEYIRLILEYLIG